MEHVMFWICVTVGLAILVNAAIGRLCGFHRPIRWADGGYLNFVSELSAGIFILSCGLALRFPAWIILAPFAWLVGFTSQRRANQQYDAREQQLRTINSSKYPGIFDNPPPDDIDSIDEDELDLFDAGACTYLGRASKKDIKALLDAFKDIPEPEKGTNDVFMLVESLELLSKESVSKEFRTLLEKAFEKRDFLELRWIPPKPEQKNYK